MLQEAAIDLLFQIDGVIVQSSDSDYRKPLFELGGASLGQHIRHALEYYICLLKGEETQRVNYDQRRHDTVLETERSVARESIRNLQGQLSRQRKNCSLTLEANLSLRAESQMKIESSFARELAYVVEHTIHHMALMSVAVRVSFPHIELPENFGVASSTIRYRKELQQK